jgi:hypothetical protein
LPQPSAPTSPTTAAPGDRPKPPPTSIGTGATVPAFDRGRFAAVIPLPGAASMTTADRVLWVRAASTVVRIDPATNAAAGRPLRVPADAEAIAIGDGALWVASVGPGDHGTAGEDQVTRIDLATGRMVATIAVRRAPLDIAATPGGVWVTNSGGGGDSVARIDPQTNRAVETVAVGGNPIDVAATAGAIWVSVANPGRVLRIAAISP